MSLSETPNNTPYDMKSILPVLSALFLLALPATAAPGGVEPGFNTLPNGEVATTTIQPDGKILIGGAFTTVGGVARNRIARLNTDGTLDADFNPNAGDAVRGMMVQADGKILISGQFTTVGGVVHNRLARLNADGTLDSGFNPNFSDWIHSMVEQADGKLVIGGEFWTVNGVTHYYLARLNADGTLDNSFNPIVSDLVRNTQLQADGKIVIGGAFWTVNGVTRNYSARLNPDGTLDSSFNPNANSSVRSTAIQADGKILIGGDFTTVGGGIVPRNRIARFNADGTLDTGFDPNAAGSVRSMVEQADGKLVIGGNFTTVGGVTRNRIARFNADGTLDTSFDPNASDSVRSVALQADGKLVIGGLFSNVGGISHNNVARLDNDAATQTLSVPSFSRIEWLRGGSSPETREVTFEVSIDGGVSYAPWGAGTRSAGGWERVGNGANPFTTYRGLPASGQVRARARTLSGHYTGSRGLVESVATFSGLAVPEIALSGNGVDIVDADAIPDMADHTDFGAQNVAAGMVVRTFTIENTGTADLILGPVNVSGANPGDFTVTVPPVSPVAAGGSTTFQVAFDPSAAGDRWAHIGIPTNDFDEYYFQFEVTGRGLSNDASLASLTPGVGTPLNPAFTPATTTYTSSVSHDTASITVTPTAAQGSASITVNGSPVTSGSASDSIPISVGFTTITAQVTAQDGVTTKTYTVVVRRAAFPPGGVAEPGFDLNLSWFDNYYIVESMSLQPDGKFITGYTDFSGNGAYGIQRWQADGTADSSGSAGMNSFVRPTAVQADGKILVGGSFAYSTFFGEPGAGITRLHAGGARDDTFHPDVNASISSIAMQSDGKILIAGGFSLVDGVTRNYVARLHAGGTLDESFTLPALGFNPISDRALSITLQTDGKIVIGGAFTSVGGLARNGIARLNADGTLDTSLIANTNDTSVYFQFGEYVSGAGKVSCTAVQADGKILIAGDFTTVNGVPRSGIARLNADGTLDAGFNTLNFAGVRNITLQADGEILLGGGFHAVGSGVERIAFARLHVDGTLDAFFDPAPNSAVFATLLQADGKIIIGGAFSAVGGVPRNYVARLDNIPATQTLSVASASRIEWLRGGSSPEAAHVTFEASTNGGASYLPLGAGTRLTGGWELTGIHLPASGLLRARARTGSGSLVETVTAFSGLLVPEIAVSGNGVNIPTGDPTPTLVDQRDFGTRIVGAGAVVRSFTLHNSGTAELTLGTTVLSGAADFTVTTAPSSPIPAGGSASLQVTFAASAAGLRSAVLSIATDDFDENPFIFSIQGTGLASTGDDDSDGVANLLEFALGTDQAGGAPGPAPMEVVNGTITRHGTPATLAATGGGMQALFGRRKDRSSAGLSYAVQFSADLSAWETSTTTLTVIADDGEIEAVTVPYPTLIGGLEARFFRLSVTLNP